jgi:hypothetical protein
LRSGAQYASELFGIQKFSNFVTPEAIEAESKAVPNNLTEHDLMDAEALGTVHTLGMGTISSSVMVAIRPKVSFRPGNYGC